MEASPFPPLWRGAGPGSGVEEREPPGSVLSAGMTQSVEPEVDERAVEDRYLADGGALTVSLPNWPAPRRSRSA